MENENPHIEQEPVSTLELTKSGQKSLKSIGSWMLFFGILYSMGILFMVIAAIIMLLTSFIKTSPMPSNMVQIMSLVYIIIAVMMVFPTYYLFNASSNLKRSIEAQSSSQLEEALKMTRNFWKTYGIMTIIAIILAIVFTIMSLVMAVSLGMSHGTYNM